MERDQIKLLIGFALIGLGVIQAASYALQSQWIPAVLGLLYSVMGIVYIWAEVENIN